VSITNKFSKLAKNPPDKVKDLSNSDENSQTGKNYSILGQFFAWKKYALLQSQNSHFGTG
jgi:hypothetical protein